MIDFEAARTAMVEGQVRTSDVTDRALLAALRGTPREQFAPKSKRPIAYSDSDVPVADGRWMLRPRDMGKLLQALEVEPGDIALNLACGRGYTAAVLARLAETVVAIDSDAALIDKACDALSAVGADNAVAVVGDVAAGAPGQGPFNVIVVDGAVEVVPDAWTDQLAEGGRLGVIVRDGPIGRAMIYTRSKGAVGARAAFDSAAPVLPGFEAPREFSFG